MRQIKYFIVGLTCIAASSLLPSTYGQIVTRNTVPDTITACYMNTTAYNRFNRQPMHINNLITIIRKIEMKTDGQWDIRRIARTLVHRYTFDGMEFSPDSKLELQYGQKSLELAKTLIIKSLIPIPPEEILPDYILDNDEKCALHWMLSHSMNATVRDEELNPYGSNPSYNPVGYPNGGTNFNTNNNNNNNNYPNPNPINNPNQNVGYNYNRGRRDVGENESSEEDGIGKADDEEGTTETQQDQKVAPQHAASSNEDYVEKESDSSESDDGYDTEDSQPAKKTNENGNAEEGSPVLNLPHDGDDVDSDDVDILPESMASRSASSKSARQVSPNKPGRTRRPIETGVVYTQWGSISAGRLIAGIAAGLEPVRMSVSGGTTYTPESSYGGSNPWSGGSGLGGNNGGYPGSGYPMKSINNNQPQIPPNPYGQQWRGQGRKKRQAQNLQPIESLYTATLAGDVGQAAILNGQFQIPNPTLPRGEFNDTVCPREYVLQQHSDPSKEIFMDSSAWTYLTEAEVRGGLDGLIIGSKIRQWSPSFTLRLSDVLSQYYSEEGVVIAGEQNFRSCERSSLYAQSIGTANLEEQARSFAALYNNRTNKISDQTLSQNPNLFNTLVQESSQRMLQVLSSFSSIDRPCTRRNSAGDQNDNQKYIVPKLTVYGVLDHSATVPEIEQQKRFFGQLAHELQVSPQGSRLGMVDGNSGTLTISPNWTDTASILACRVLSIPTQMKTQDYNRVMTNLKTEIERVKNEEQRVNYTSDNGIVILMMVQGKKLEETQRNEIIRIQNEITQQFDDVAVIATSNKFPESDFQGLQFVKLSTAQNFSDDAQSFAQSLLRTTHGSLRYGTCNAFLHSQDNEHLLFRNFWISPGDIQYYKITPNYFFSARSLMLRFTSDNGRVRVCQARTEPFPNSSNQGTNGVSCQESKGTWIAPGRNEIDIQFEYQQPCGKHGKREGCGPIFLSITPITSTTLPGQGGGMDCTIEGCQSANQVKVTYTHWGMRCNGAMKTALSSTFAVLTIILSLVNWVKSV